MKRRAGRAASEDEALRLVRLRLRATLFSGLGTGWGAAPPASYWGQARTGAGTTMPAGTPAPDGSDMGAVLASGRTAVTGPPRRRSRAAAVIRALPGWFGRGALPERTRAPARASSAGTGASRHRSHSRPGTRAGRAHCGKRRAGRQRPEPSGRGPCQRVTRAVARNTPPDKRTQYLLAERGQVARVPQRSPLRCGRRSGHLEGRPALKAGSPGPWAGPGESSAGQAGEGTPVSGAGS